MVKMEDAKFCSMEICVIGWLKDGLQGRALYSSSDWSISLFRMEFWDKKLPGKEETAKKVKPRPEKTSNGGGTKATRDLHIAEREEDIGYYAGYVGELMIVTTYLSYSSPFCSLTSVLLQRGFIDAW
ncbi:hypothetical protein ACFX15_025645 [Malus domestica]